MAGIRMASPWKDPRTGILYLRVRVPADLVGKADGRKVALPVGDGSSTVTVGKTFIKVSLATRDPAEGKARFIVAQAALTSFWDALRRGPQRLTHVQRVGLAGEVRARVLSMFHDDPGDPEEWRIVQRINQAIASEDAVGFLPGRQAGESATPAEMAEYRFGAALDMVLTERALILDPADRAPLIGVVAKAMQEAAEVNLRKAEGDYSPDLGAARYPAFAPPVADAPTPAAPAMTFAVLFGFWEREHLADGKRPRTVKDFRHKLDNLAAFVGHDDATAVTEANIADWTDHLRHEKGLAAKTVGQKYLGAVKAIYGVARAKRKLPLNPAANIKARTAKQVRTRSKGFTDDEAKAILSCALRAPSTLGKMTDLNKLAIRWIPWLGAYTGARVGELAQLRKVDLFKHGGVTCIRITPEAGSVKSSAYRLVPVHPHLLDMGIEALFRDATTPHLFFTLTSPDQDPADRAQAVSKRVAAWVREVAGVTDPVVRPTHGWRHRLKTVGRDVDIAPEYLDAIQGHEDGRAASDYGEMTMKALGREIRKLPRYPVG